MARTRVAKCDSDGRLRRGGPACSSSRAMTGSLAARMRAAAGKVAFRPGWMSDAVVIQSSLAHAAVIVVVRLRSGTWADRCRGGLGRTPGLGRQVTGRIPSHSWDEDGNPADRPGRVC